MTALFLFSKKYFTLLLLCLKENTSELIHDNL